MVKERMIVIQEKVRVMNNVCKAGLVTVKMHVWQL